MTSDRPDERRRAPRVDTSIKATVSSGKRSVPFVIDSISISGARLNGPLALAKGAKVSIVFAMDDARLEIDAEVVRVDTADLMTDQIAVRFIDPSADNQTTLRQLVNRLLDEAWSGETPPPAPDPAPEPDLPPDEDDEAEVVIEPDD